MNQTKTTAILLILQNHPDLSRQLVNSKTLTFDLRRAMKLLNSVDESLYTTKEFLVMLCVDLWLEKENFCFHILGELLENKNLQPAISGIKLYLEA